MRRVRILFLGGAKRVSMGRKFIEAGRRLGFEVELFSYELSPYVPVAEIAGIIIGRKWSAPDLYEHLRATVEEYGIDILVPFVDGAVEVAARYRDLYGDIWVPVGDAAGAARMFDKIEADRFFRQAGLPVPSNTAGLPLIAKPRFGSASKGIRIINDEAELAGLAPHAGDYLIQEYIADRREITVDCYVTLSGKIICAVPRYRLETQGGEASVTRTFRNPEVEGLARQTLEATGLRGAVTIQMIERLAPAGGGKPKYLLMEINPRLGGGAVCACHAGASLPEFILRDCFGPEPEPCVDWRSGTLVTRYFSEVCFNLSDNGAE